MKRLLAVISTLVFVATPTAFAQTHSPETEARVPALENLHVPIAQLWHTAWPAKDVSMMVTLLPELQKATAELAATALPGILRDKQSQWKAGVERLQGTLQAYGKAADGRDSLALLATGEELHARYEALVRMIRPVVKELGQFHETLYVLYHRYVPESNMDSVATAAIELKKRMTTLNAAKLPERLKAKHEQFSTARAALSASVDAFADVAPRKEKAKITAALERLHTDYQALEKVFD